MNENEEVRFFAALAGHGSDDPSNARIRALRQSIKLRAEVLREVSEVQREPARLGELTERQKALFNELEAHGVFSDPAISLRDNSSRGTRSPLSLLSLLTGFLGANWGKPLAFAAMLALVVGIVLQQGGLDRSIDESQIVRGQRHPTVLQDEPSQFVADLTAHLEADGAIVTAVQINDREWGLKVSVPPGAGRESIQAHLKSAGFDGVSSEGDIELTVRKP